MVDMSIVQASPVVVLSLGLILLVPPRLLKRPWRFGCAGLFVLSVMFGSVVDILASGVLVARLWVPSEEELREAFQALVQMRNRKTQGDLSLMNRIAYLVDWVVFCGWSLALNAIAWSSQASRSLPKTPVHFEKLETEVLTTPIQAFRQLPRVGLGRHNFATSHGYTVSYVDRGPVDAKLTLLCLHGIPTWSYTYRHLAEVFAADEVEKDEEATKVSNLQRAPSPPSLWMTFSRQRRYSDSYVSERRLGRSSGATFGRKSRSNSLSKDEEFPLKFRVILLDFLGFGMSDKPSSERACSPLLQIDIVYELIEHLKLSNIVLVMHDYSSVIGQCCIPSLYDKIDSIVLLHTNLGVNLGANTYGSKCRTALEASKRGTCMEREALHFWDGYIRIYGARPPSEVLRIWSPRDAKLLEKRRSKPRPLAKDSSLSSGENTQIEEESGEAKDEPSGSFSTSEDPYDIPYPGEAHKSMLKKWQESIYCQGEEGGRMATQLSRAQLWQQCHFTKPVLAIFGDQDLFLDVQTKEAGQKFVRRVYPGSKRIEVDLVNGGGRFLLETHPSAVIGKLWSFVGSRAKALHSTSASGHSKAKSSRML